MSSTIDLVQQNNENRSKSDTQSRSPKLSEPSSDDSKRNVSLSSHCSVHGLCAVLCFLSAISLATQPLLATEEDLVLPDEGLKVDPNLSYLIERKRFVEAVQTRCLASTVLDDPSVLEPHLVLIRPQTETRLKATASLESIIEAGFDPKKRTTIVVHGFGQSYPRTTWLRRLRGLFENHAHVYSHNLIFMDWGKASRGPYTQVAAATSLMGSFLANFIMKLIELGVNRQEIHLIGHSLGAHVSGFAGKRIRPHIGRITALDPAGPCFGKLLSNSPNDRLAPTDAIEVDVYHYDDDFLGLPGQHGQFDVYVNGGSSQPGCKDNVNSMFSALVTLILHRRQVLSESHSRSTDVCSMQLSVSGCQQMAYECRDWAAFTSGECGKCDDQNNQCFFMGFSFQYTDIPEVPLRTSYPGKRFYISTSSSEAYCLHHYQVLVKFEPSPEMAQMAKRNKWRLGLGLITDDDDRIDVTVTNQMAPNVFSYLLLTEARPFRIKAAILHGRNLDGSSVPLLGVPSKRRENKPSFQVLSIEVNFMSNINPNIRRAMSSQLCFTRRSSDKASDINHVEESSVNKKYPDGWLQFDECLSLATLGTSRQLT